MARLSKELLEQIDIEINKNRYIYDTLKASGGGLYLDDLANVLDRHINSLKYQIKNGIQLELLDITKCPTGTTRKSVIRLTSRCWRKLGFNRGMISIQEETLDRCLFKAIVNKELNFICKKEDLFNHLPLESLKYSILDIDDIRTKRKSIYSNLSTLYKNKNILIREYILDEENEDIYLDIYYIKRYMSQSEVNDIAEIIDLSVGILEWYSLMVVNRINWDKNLIKIRFNVFTESYINVDLKMKDIRKYKRNYHSFTKQNISNKVQLFYTVKLVLDDNINFMKLDKYNYCFKKL